MNPNSQRIEAVRVGCRASEAHLSCEYPTCKCRQIPTAIMAVLDAQRSGPAEEAVALLRCVRKTFPDLEEYEDGDGNSLRPLAERIDRALKNAGNNSPAGVAESQAPSIRDGEAGVAPGRSAASPAPQSEAGAERE